jgi:CheY-like chemotaxis protein
MGWVLAENGKEAIGEFTKYMQEGILFELILMDLIMPEMNGYDATVEIRKLEKEFGLNENEKHFICGFSAEVNDCKL